MSADNAPIRFWADNAPILSYVEVTTCFYCGKETTDWHWFARLRRDSGQVTFCRPHCLELFLEQGEHSTPDGLLDREMSGAL